MTLLVYFFFCIFLRIRSGARHDEKGVYCTCECVLAENKSIAIKFGCTMGKNCRFDRKNLEK